MESIEFQVNGKSVSVDVEPRALLVDVLRDQLGLTGTHVGCDTSQCGCCTVRMNGNVIKSCSTLAIQAGGAAIETIEGLAGEKNLHPIQQAFAECHGLQCGFCTPGMIMSTLALLEHSPIPTQQQIRTGLSGNLCRCTGYVNIERAVQSAATAIRVARDNESRNAGSSE
ncbi:MAG: (2Fe-2S)-binding protein [Pseudomonadota bacterium]